MHRRTSILAASVIAGLLVVSTRVAYAAPFEAADYEKGDVNGDGVVTMADLAALQQAVLPGGDPTFGGMGSAAVAADVAPYGWHLSGYGPGIEVKRELGRPGDADPYKGAIVLMPGSPDGTGVLDARDVAALRQALGTADVDGDGLTGYQEALVGTNPFMEFSDGDNADRMKDQDNDNLSDLVELGLGLDFASADSDDDGFRDDVEIAFGMQPDVVDGQGDPDGDGLFEAAELAAGTSPIDADTDGDSIDDDVELANGTNPLSTDTDFDGILDDVDACPADAFNDDDLDGVCHLVDNCPYAANAGQLDDDGDGFGNECDSLTLSDGSGGWVEDVDFDHVDDAVDNCPAWPDPDQLDDNSDSIGNVCQCGDVSGDGSVGDLDLVMLARDLSTAGVAMTVAEQTYLDGVLSDPSYASVGYAPAGSSHKCDLNGDFVCTGEDVKVLAGLLASSTPPAYACGDIRRLEEHVLNRIGYGGTLEERRRLRHGGLFGTLAAGFDVSAPDPAGDAAIAPYSNPEDEYAILNQNIYEKRLRYCNFGKCPMRVHNNHHVYDALREIKILRSIYSRHQLESKLLDFWFNHFNIRSSPGLRIWAVPEYELQDIRNNQFGYFEDLLWATANGIAMLEYLDQRSSHFNGSVDKTNENFAREVMELHSIGTIDTYDEPDVKEVTRLLTGLYFKEFAEPPGGGGPNWVSYYEHSRHAPGEKTVTLNASPHPDPTKPDRWDAVEWTFDHDDPAAASGCGDASHPRYIAPPGTVDPTLAPPGSPRWMFPRIAESEAEVFLCLLARHPATAYLVGEKLVKRFVTDRTAPGTRGGDLVERLVTVWNTPGTEGNLAAVLSALLSDPEFTAGIHYGSKAKRPLDFMASLWRSIGPGSEGTSSIVGELNEPGSRSHSFRAFYGYITKMGEDLFLIAPPTGLPEESAYWASASGAVLRWNWADLMVDQALRSGEIDPLDRFGLTEGASASEIVTAMADDVMPGSVTSTTRTAIETHLDSESTADPSLTTSDLVRRGASLLFSSPEFARH